MDPPADPPAARQQQQPPSVQRRRRGTSRLVEWTLHFTISFVILSLLKLEPMARNSVQNHNSDIDLPNRLSMFETSNKNKTEVAATAVVSTSFSVDILSVASIDTKRMELLNAQKRILTSHSSVRNFFNVTEVDDYDPTCYKDLTLEQVEAVSNFCRKRPPGLSYEMRFMRAQYARKQFINKKKNPAGWLCAIPRPYSGLRKAYLHYKENRQELPDYFIVMDDDTYYNIETFEQIHNKLNSTEQTVVAGCLVRWPIQQINFTFPWGGYGTVFSKNALKYLFHSIRHCPPKGEESSDDHPNAEGICNQLSKNIVGELKYYENGNSLLDIIYKYVSMDRYRDVAKWDWRNHGGFCMHSDWVMGYFVNYYNVSRHVEMKKFENVPHARIESFEGSDVYARPSGYCKNEGSCKNGTMICHKGSVEWMEKEVMKWKAATMLSSDAINKNIEVSEDDDNNDNFCGSNNWLGTQIRCDERVQFMVRTYQMSQHNAKITILENGCQCR